MQLSQVDYGARLNRVEAALDGGALLVMAQPIAYRNSSVEHAWRQDSTFFYLTGFEEPDAALLILPFKPEGERHILFLRDKDPERELWDGRRLGVTGAKSQLTIDQAQPFPTLWQKLPDLLGEANKLYCNLGQSPEYDREIIQALITHKNRHGKKHHACKIPIYDAGYLAGKLRLRKGPEEVERLRIAASATRKAYAKMYQTVRPGLTERDVYGLLLGEFLANGGDREAYGSIVAGGANACVLHYRENNMPLHDGDVLLIDAGAEFQCYASDVTRTLPVGKRFSAPQKAIYEIVLEAQKAAIAKATVGSSLPAIHDEATRKLVDGLLQLKLMQGHPEELIAKGAHKKYFPHGTSHWIGMDVHDVGVYQEHGKPVGLEPGMYFSVEPGLYFDPKDESVPAAFRGIGVRIEDDVLVTSGGPDVVTTGIAKEVRELENRN